MRFATWNIGSSYRGGESSFVYMADTILACRPDVLALQELWTDDGYLQALSKQLDMPYYIIKELSPAHQIQGRMGIGLFSTVEIQKKERFVLCNPQIQATLSPSIATESTSSPIGNTFMCRLTNGCHKHAGALRTS